MINNRRDFLRMIGGTVGLGILPPSILKALSIKANRKTGTIKDVEHIVILTQENRSFDHYFGTMNGVRGFSDRFAIPIADAFGNKNKNVMCQVNHTDTANPQIIPPFRFNTVQKFDYMRATGTPHSWLDAQGAWNNGLMNNWPKYKKNHSMGYYTAEDIPFQYAMANAFTICDAYHCSFQGGTNTNRLFLWSGTNDPLCKGNGPATYNNYDWFDKNPGDDGGYTWTTYPERLQKAGVTWQIYQNMEDNYTDNALAGFHNFRDAWFEKPNHSPALRERGVSTRDIDKLKEDVLADKLPQVSWIVATAKGSEHPNPSSPAQGADYTAKILEALTANPEVWSKTVFIVNFDENDGFFDHVPPPAVPSYTTFSTDPKEAVFAGASTVDTTGEYHETILPYHKNPLEPLALHRAYGLGPRVPMYVISPWSKGGWVNSQVFDHTSIIRFIEERFGVREPNISAWRRAVCGDLTTVFNFKDPDNTNFDKKLPNTVAQAKRACALDKTIIPPIPTSISMPIQATGTRPARALPYELHTSAKVLSNNVIQLRFNNTGSVAAVFHVYNRKNLNQIPRRYTVEANKQLTGNWESTSDNSYDLWVLGPNGFHRHFTGDTTSPSPEVKISYDALKGNISLNLSNNTKEEVNYTITTNAYFSDVPLTGIVEVNSEIKRQWSLRSSGYWYDFTVTLKDTPKYSRRFAGHVETGKSSISDPMFGGIAISEVQI
ncbi:MAG: phospholipase C, phosphocholine-specific [Sulfurimonas sp.]|nr:phospholipase C, phosphocholine-specific [Sulfurimonas sp.]